METTQPTTHYEAHYTSGNLKESIAAMLAAAGTSAEKASPDQMAAFDQFHVRGIEATNELASLAGFKKGQKILDVGSGIGGPARYLNATVGCQVNGIDLTKEFVEAAVWLTEAQRQQGQVSFVQGSALQTPFADASYDGAWMQHVNMNIADKTGLFREVARVLKPGASYAMHEIVAHKANQPHFPVPWATGPEGSHLAHEPELRRTLESAGFEVVEWKDETQASIAWFQGVFARLQADGPPKIGVGVLLGPQFPEMAKNVVRSMEDGLIKVVVVVAKRQ